MFISKAAECIFCPLLFSLEGRLDDGELQELLDDLQTHRDHQ